MPTINLTSYKTLFLSQENLNEYSLIRDDVDMSVLTPTIRAVQDYHLYKLLGSSLFVDLQNKITAGSLNQDELLLIQGYIVPTMAWGVMKEAPIFISMKYTNRGVVQMTGTNSQPTSLSDLQALGDMANRHYELYAERLVKYLIGNANLFPAYRQMTVYNDVTPATDGWDPRIALGNRPVKTGLHVIEGGGSSTVNITADMIAYYNTSVIKKDVSHTGNTANFSGSFLAAPSGLPYTSVGNFNFYDNSNAIPRPAIVSFVDNGNSTCTLIVDTTILGYSFQIADVISAAGKFQ